MKKILIVLLNVLIIFTFIGLEFTESFASEGSISAPSSVTVGDNITVTVNIPADAVAYQGEIIVKYSDGSEQKSGVLANVTGITGDYAHPGNMTYTASAKSEGTATITVANLNITDKNGNKVNANSTLTANVTVNKKQEATQPVQTTTPTTTPTTTTPTTTTPTTTSTDPTFTNVSETVTANETVNVRSSWSSTSSKLGQIEKGSSVLRTGIGSNGWDRVTYNGKIGYIMSKYLTKSNTTTTTTTTSTDPTFTNVNETVTASEKVNVRSSWSATSSKLGQIEKGKTIVRTGVGSNGWDRVTYDGKVGYVMSKYLTNPTANQTTTNTTDTNTTPTEPTWRETGDTVYATTNMNVREGWDKTFKSIGGLMKGDKTTRIAVGSNGWDKIKFEGKTAYVLSRLLTTEVVEPDEPEEENTVDNTTNTNRVDVTANMADEEKDVYNQLIEEVGVLPAVGRSYGDIVYTIAVLAVISMVGFVGLKIRNNEEE